MARPRAGPRGRLDASAIEALLQPAALCFGDVTDPADVARAMNGERFDAVVSCLATRGGGIEDAWRIEHRANLLVLELAMARDVPRFVYLSAICVQRPRLAFQHAKLAFERALQDADIEHVIVRPTAFFKSISGQVARVRDGKPFLVFGDGNGTACKPIAEADVGDFLARCVVDDETTDRILPVGGPDPAITPREQGALLFSLLDRPPAYRRVPVAVLDAAVAMLSLGGRLVPSLRDRAEFARIGRYYATESMLLWDDDGPNAEATPSFGHRSLRDHYARMLTGETEAGLGEHAVFDR